MIPIKRAATSLIFSLMLTAVISPGGNVYAYDAQDNSEKDDALNTASLKAESPASDDARPQMVKVTSKGITPPQMTMRQSDSVVFFYNDTEDDLITLEVEFGARAVHCASALKVIKEPGLARSRKPFGPKEFVSTCFHDKGLYSYRIYTSKKGNPPYTGTVTVQ